LKSSPDATTSLSLFELDTVETINAPLLKPSRVLAQGRVGGRNTRVETQGIKYAGSKLKLLPNILEIVEDLGVRRIWDAFSGSTRVSQAFAKRGYEVESNDLALWSEQFGRAYLLNKRQPHEYSDLIEHLNGIDPIDGWFTREYGGLDYDGSAVQLDGSKKLWQLHNTKKLDGIRQEIDRLALDDVTKAVALSSLILALDKVDSTMGHFVSYLREWSPRSYGSLRLEVPHLWPNEIEHKVTRKDVLEGAEPVGGGADLAYLDPPYGSNNEKMPPSRVRYQSYYHVWTTIIQNDEPETFGAANRRVDSSDTVAASVFEDYRRNKSTGRFVAVEAIDGLIARTDTPYVMLSYSSDGRATASEVNEVLHANGNLISTAVINYKRNVMSGMVWTNEWLREVETSNQEFIFLLEK
jgi:adenine-specific DNA-methyltransferase